MKQQILIQTFSSIFDTDRSITFWEPINTSPNNDQLIYKGKFFEFLGNGWVEEHYELYPDILVKDGFQLRLCSFQLRRLKPTEAFGPHKYGIGFLKGQYKLLLYTESIEALNVWHDHLKRLCLLPNFNKRHQIIQKLRNSSNFYDCVKCINGNQYQVKIIEKTSTLNQKSIIKEVAILRRLNHPILQRLLEVYEDSTAIYILFDKFLGHSLKSKLQEYQNLSEKQQAEVCYKLLNGLSHIHGKDIIHKDIRLENIIQMNNSIYNLIIANFSSAEFTDKNRKKRIFNPGFMAPELFQNKPYNEKIDVFSMGIIFYSFFYNRFPFEGKDLREISLLNEKCDINYDYQKKISSSAIELLKCMLHKDPNQRVTAQIAMKHHWFINSRSKIQVNVLGAPSLSTILEKTELEMSVLNYSQQMQKIRSKSVDTMIINDATEIEQVPLFQKVLQMQQYQFNPSKSNH